MAVAPLTRRTAELGLAATLIVAAGFLYVQAERFPGFTGAYPRTLCILLALTSGLMFVRTLLRRTENDSKPLFENAGRVAIGVAVLVVYIGAVSTLGYILPSLVLGIALPFMLGYRNFRLTALVTLGTLAFIIVVFVVLLGRPVPRDVLDPLLVFIR